MMPGMSYKTGMPPQEWYDKRFVPMEKVNPLVLWLEKLYGGLSTVSEVTGIPYHTLSDIKHKNHDRVMKSLAFKIVEFVKAHKHGERSFSTFELEEPPRYATEAEKSLPQNFSRWRAVDGRKKS
jgi:hypothetical protein